MKNGVLKMGFKSEKKHSNTCCGKRVEHVVSSSSRVVLLFFIYLFTLFSSRFLKAYFGKRSLI